MKGEEMQSLRKAAQQALDFFERKFFRDEFIEELEQSITALRVALAEDVTETNFGNMAQVVDSKESDHIADDNKMMATIRPEVTVEPVAWTYTDARGRSVVVIANTAPYDDAKPLYSAPPQRKPLTDEQLVEAYCCVNDKEWAIGGMTDARIFARAIERAHDIGE